MEDTQTRPAHAGSLRGGPLAWGGLICILCFGGLRFLMSIDDIGYGLVPDFDASQLYENRHPLRWMAMTTGIMVGAAAVVAGLFLVIRDRMLSRGET